MTKLWKTILEDSEHVSNVRIVCVDGVIISHKIIVASVSNFIKNIITDIPTNDEVTIFLPDFRKIEVEKCLNLSESFYESGDIFGGQSITYHSLKSEENISTQYDIVKEEGEDSLHDSVKPEILHTEDECADNDLSLEDVHESPSKMKKMKKELRNICTEALAASDDYPNGHCDQVIKDIEKDIIQNPKTLEEKALNKKLHRKLAYEKAKLYYLSGQCDSVRKAAKIFNVDNSSLSKILKAGTIFKGKGRRSSYFTSEEEKNIVDRALQIVHSGQNFDSGVLKQLIIEEFEVIKVNFPEKSSKINSLIGNHPYFLKFTICFAKKNDLKKYFSEDTRQRNFECDICCKKFTFKNCLVKHQKSVHYSFLT